MSLEINYSPIHTWSIVFSRGMRPVIVDWAGTWPGATSCDPCCARSAIKPQLHLRRSTQTVAELQTAFCRPHSLSCSSKVAIADRSKPATRAGFIIIRVVCTLLQTDNHTNTPPLWPLIVILPRASTHLNQALPTTGILCRCKNSAVAFKQRGFFRCILHYTLGKLVDRACDGRRQFITLGGHHDGAPQRVSRVRRRQVWHRQL